MLLIITEENRLLNFTLFREASIEEEDGVYKLSIVGLLEGVRTNRIDTYPVAKFDKEDEAVEALRSLQTGIKTKSEWDAKAFKECRKDS